MQLCNTSACPQELDRCSPASNSECRWWDDVPSPKMKAKPHAWGLEERRMGHQEGTSEGLYCCLFLSINASQSCCRSHCSRRCCGQCKEGPSSKGPLLPSLLHPLLSNSQHKPLLCMPYAPLPCMLKGLPVPLCKIHITSVSKVNLLVTNYSLNSFRIVFTPLVPGFLCYFDNLNHFYIQQFSLHYSIFFFPMQ